MSFLNNSTIENNYVFLIVGAILVFYILTRSKKELFQIDIPQVHYHVRQKQPHYHEPHYHVHEPNMNYVAPQSSDLSDKLYIGNTLEHFR